MALNQKESVRIAMIPNRIENTGALIILKEIMRQKLGEIKQSHNQNKSSKQNRRKNEYPRKRTKIKKSAVKK